MEKDERAKKVYNFIKGNILNGVVAITSTVYIFYNMVIIKRTDLTIAECLASASIGVFVGFIIKQSLGENGFTKGYNSQIWVDNLEKYSLACNMANEYIDRVDNFYLSEEIEKKRNYRRTNLMAIRLRYKDFFDEDGNYIEHTILTQRKADKLRKTGKISALNDFYVLNLKQYAILKKCVKVKIYNLNLFSEYSNEIENDTKKEKTDADQRARMFTKNSFAMLTTAIVGAYFTAMWNAWDWGTFIASTIQVLIWIACGVIELYKNYNYIVVDKVSKMKRKSEQIMKFINGCKNGLYRENPYDKDEVKENDRQENIYTQTDSISY